jgi:hypothetical protein
MGALGVLGAGGRFGEFSSTGCYRPRKKVLRGARFFLQTPDFIVK